MTERPDGHAHDHDRRRARRWRLAAWSAAAALLVLPGLATRFTDAVAWDAVDFALAAALVAGVGVAWELAARRARGGAYHAAVGVALATAALLAWANSAVGIIGSEDNPANRMHAAVLAVGIAGAVLARARPRPMARALVATALAQALVAVLALAAGLGAAPAVTAFFVALWLVSAWLFRRAARQERAGPDGRHAAPG